MLRQEQEINNRTCNKNQTDLTNSGEMEKVANICLLTTMNQWTAIKQCCFFHTTNQILLQIGNVLLDVKQFLLVIVETLRMSVDVMMLTLNWIDQMSRLKVACLVIRRFIRNFKHHYDLKWRGKTNGEQGIWDESVGKQCQHEQIKTHTFLIKK